MNSLYPTSEHMIGPDGDCYVCNNGGLKWHSEELGAMRPLMQSDDYVGGSIQRVGTESIVVSAPPVCVGRPDRSQYALERRAI